MSRLAVLFVAITLLGASCLGAGGGQNQTIVDPFPRDPIIITIWSSLDDLSAFQPGMEGYHQAHPTVTFNHQFIPPDQIVAKVIDALATGQGPDIITIPNDHIPLFKDKLVAMPDQFFDGTPVTTAMTAQYAPAVATDVIHEGKVFGIPFYTDSLAIYVNTQIFSQLFGEYIVSGKPFREDLLLRPPVDWGEVVEATHLITKRSGDTIERSAIALGTSTNVPFMSDITTAMLLQRGVDMTSVDRANATFHLADPADPAKYPGAQTLEFFKRFTDPSSDTYTWNADMPDAVQAFIDGKVAMMIHYQAIGPYLRQRNPALRFTTGPLPQLVNARTIVDFARYRVQTVTNNSQHPEIAWDFLRYMNSLGFGDYITRLGRQSPTRQLPPTITVAERVYSDPFTIQIGTARSWYKGTNPTRADQIMNQALDRVTRDNHDAKESLNQAAEELTAELQSGP